MRGRRNVLALVALWVAALPATLGLAGESPAEWSAPDIASLPDDENSQLIRLGHDLTVSTSALIGPGAADPAKRYAGNRLSCQNCHLEAGTKQFGLPFVGVSQDFPQYRAREGRVIGLEERVNGCVTRSLNGRKLPEESREMRGFVAYIAFLSQGPKRNGRGAGMLPELARAADPVRGRIVFEHICATCHGADGQGKKREDDSRFYEFPPLWGPDSFNDGAGMNRLIAAANFIHSNMPNGATWRAPVLGDDDAWDVAAFVIGRDRPHKQGLEEDFPNRLEKPVDAAYPPFADGFDPEGHRFGPFAPIRAAIRALSLSGTAAPPKTN
jgi:thiosulfate dehydrogenase